MLNGMTAWLESIDQKAGELAERQKTGAEETQDSGRSHTTSLVSLNGGSTADVHEGYRVRRGNEEGGQVDDDEEHRMRITLEKRLRDAQQQQQQPSILSFPTGPSLATTTSNIDDAQDNVQKDEDEGSELHSHASSSSSSSSTHSSSALPDEVAPLPLLSRERGVDALKLQCASLQQQVQDRTEELQAMARDLDAGTTRLRELERQRVELQDRLRQGEQDLSATRAQLRQSEAAHLQDEQTLHMLQEQQQATLREFDAYKAQSRHLLEEKERQIRALTTRKDVDGNDEQTVDTESKATDAELIRLRQRVETLQEQLSAMKIEVGARVQDSAAAQRALQAVRAEKEQLAAKLSGLAMELQAAQEALEGEVEAHKATSATLRSLQGNVPPNAVGSPGRLHAGQDSTSVAAAYDEASLLASSTELAKCQEALAETTQRCQLLSYQLTQKQIALDASERHVAELQSRYQEVMCFIDDENVAAEAGYTNTNSNISHGNSKREALAGPYSRHSTLATTAVPVMRHREDKVLAQGGGGSAASYNMNTFNRNMPAGPAMAVQELRRTRPMMVLLSRRTRIARGVGSVLSAMDGIVLRVLRLFALWPLARLVLLCLVLVYVLSFLSLVHSPVEKEVVDAATLAATTTVAVAQEGANDVIEGTQQAA